MKKASKILTLILVFVILAGMFAGCAMFPRNTARYRSLVAVNVGNEEITVGKILDTFNNYYATYGNYIGQGITVDYLLQITMQSVVTQAMKVDAYANANKDATTDNVDLKEFCHNAQYLTKEEMEFTVRYVKYLTFHSFDDGVISQLSAGRTIGNEETEDTSRNFTELDDLEGRDYSEFNYRSRVFSDTADKYFEKYYNGVEIKLNSNVDEYVYTDADAAKAMLDSLNKRKADDDAEITFDEYKTAQEKIVKQYQRTIKNTYGIDFDQFMINQVSDMVASTIAAKYDYSVNKVIDTTDLNDTLATLTSNLQINSAAQKKGFELNDNFVDFIESLSSDSYIYNVPEDYNYIFVKNILIPFTAQQKATLENRLKEVGNNSKAESYVELRNHYASLVIADDFNSDKDEKGKYAPVSGIFKTDDNGKLIVNPDGELGKTFVDGKVVASEGKTLDETVIDYMKRFNTDTAQHTAQYNYVVRVGNIPAGYKSNWVTEFDDAAKEAYEGGIGSYALAVSTYGVHIVYYSAPVEAQKIEFTADSIKDTSLPEYRLFKAYFSEQSSRLLQDKLEVLQKSYLDDNKISTNKNFNRFLKDNKFKFDLIEFLTDED